MTEATLLPAEGINPNAQLNARVQQALTAITPAGRRQLHFQAHEGRVVLEGVVSTYYQKQLAQEALRYVDGIDQLDNLLEVERS